MRLNNVEIEILKGRLGEGYEWITRNYEDKIMLHIKYPKPDMGWYGMVRRIIHILIMILNLYLKQMNHIIYVNY